MLGNLINRHDFAELRRIGWVTKKLARRFSLGREGRVVEVWSHRPSTSGWTDLDPVIRRMNRMISGDPNTEYWEYVDRKFFASSSGLVGLSLGCGAGTRELHWAGLGRFSRIDAYDVSAPQIEQARRNAREQGLDTVLNFQVGSVYDQPVPEEAYDVVLVEHALHHFTPLREVLTRIERALKPTGLFVVNEFVGPTRFQWTARQVEAVDAVLTLLPKRLRRRVGTAAHKARNSAPSILRMIMSDPSEAVESAEIRPLLREMFDVIDVREYGGTILSLALSEIAQNFMEGDEESMKALEMSFDAEDVLLTSGELSSDFALIVCRRSSGASR